MSAGGRAAALAQLDRARCCAACRLRADDRHSIEQSIAGLAVFGSGFGDAVALKPSLHAARFAGSRFAIPARSFSLCWPQHRRDCRSCRAPPGCPVLAPCLSALFVSGLFVSAPARRAPERATRTPGEGNPCRDPGSPASLQLSWRCASMSPRASRPDESFTGTGRTAGDEAPRINRIAHVAHIAHTPAITIHFSISPILLVEHRATGRIAV